MKNKKTAVEIQKMFEEIRISYPELVIDYLHILIYYSAILSIKNKKNNSKMVEKILNGSIYSHFSKTYKDHKKFKTKNGNTYSLMDIVELFSESFQFFSSLNHSIYQLNVDLYDGRFNLNETLVKISNAQKEDAEKTLKEYYPETYTRAQEKYEQYQASIKKSILYSALFVVASSVFLVSPSLNYLLIIS